MRRDSGVVPGVARSIYLQIGVRVRDRSLRARNLRNIRYTPPAVAWPYRCPGGADVCECVVFHSFVVRSMPVFCNSRGTAAHILVTELLCQEW